MFFSRFVFRPPLIVRNASVKRNVLADVGNHKAGRSRHQFKENLISSTRIHKENQRDILAKIVTAHPTVSEKVVNDIKTQVLAAGSEVHENNFDAVFIEVCGQNNAFDLGKFHFQRLHEAGRANLGTIRKFFKLCYTYRDLCREEERNCIVELYKDIMSKYPSLDVGTYESLACGLSVTRLWKDSLQLLEVARQLETPSSAMYSAIIEASFIDHEPDLGWKLLEEMSTKGKKPNKSVFTAFLSNYHEPSALQELLSKVCRYGLELSEDVANLIIKFHHQFTKSEQCAQFAKITDKGVCTHCKRSLRRVTVSPEEFKMLKNKFLDPVLIGRDIFLKSRPDEVESYLRFLSDRGRVDVVIDGLNVAYAGGARKGSPFIFSKMLKDVVRHFVKKNMKIMVIGRKHMTLWPKINMDYVFSQSAVFLADNISSDDPLVMYGAMYSGLGTMFVSRDAMRSHRFLLRADPSLINIFLRWQQKHQCYLKYVHDSGNVTFHEPVVYLQEGHLSEDGRWHIPVKDKHQEEKKTGVSSQFHHTLQHWLCLPSINYRSTSS